MVLNPLNTLRGDMTKKRVPKLVGFNLFRDTEPDIIDWVESIPKGMVSEYMKAVIRHWLTGHIPPAPKEHVEVADVVDMFTQMSRKLDELLTRPAVMMGSIAQVSQPQDDDGLSTDEINERMTNMANIDFGDWG